MDAFREVQHSMAAYDKGQLRATFVDPASAHITFAVMRLDLLSDDPTAPVRACMDRAAGQLREQGLLRPITFPVEGLCTFEDQVLYLNVPPGPGLTQLYQFASIVRRMAAPLLHSSDMRFLPHATIAKCSASRRLVKRIPPEAYSMHRSISAGSMTATEMQLCCMVGRPREQYYDVDWSMPLA